jgi:hypothetical protein
MPKTKKSKSTKSSRQKKEKGSKSSKKDLSPEELAQDYAFFNKDRDDLVDLDEYDFDND